MARPNKQGLDYFPLDVGIFENEKILAISGEFAVKGEIIVLRLLCEIYRNGYFVEFSELLKNKLAKLGGLSGGLVEEVVKQLVKYGFFDGSLFSEYNILTSKNIQKTFLEATKRRKEIDISQFWLLNGVNANINNTSSGVNANINSQSKVNKSKVNVLLEKEPKMYIGDFSKNSENDFSKNENPNPELKSENKKRQTKGGGGENSKHGGYAENSNRNGEILNEHAEVEKMYVESEKEPKKARFCKPTLSEVQEYCYARQNLVDAERFYNYYESNGWKVGKNPMKDWKACVRTWERNEYDTKTNVNQYGTNTDANNEPKFGRMPASEVAKSISGWGD